MATFSYFGYLCGYLPMCGLDTQESILATKVSNLRNKSHLYSKMTTCVSNSGLCSISLLNNALTLALNHNGIIRISISISLFINIMHWH